MLILFAVVLLVTSLACSAVLTALSKRLASRFGLLAHPQADRYHRTVIPLGGGIAIFGTLALFVLAAAGFVRFLAVPGYLGGLTERANVVPADFLQRCDELAVVLGCATLLFVIGLWDDKKPLEPWIKFAAQWGAAVAAAAFADIRAEFFIESRVVTVAMSAFWIVLIMNAFNFLDNMDGLNAGVAAISAAILASAAMQNGQVFVPTVAVFAFRAASQSSQAQSVNQKSSIMISSNSPAVNSKISCSRSCVAWSV